MDGSYSLYDAEGVVKILKKEDKKWNKMYLNESPKNLTVLVSFIVREYVHLCNKNLNQIPSLCD